MFHGPHRSPILERGCGTEIWCEDALEEKRGELCNEERPRRLGQGTAAAHEQQPTGLDSRSWMDEKSGEGGKEGLGE